MSPLAQTVFAWCIAACLGTTVENSPQTTRKPNVLMFIADDMGYGDLASYGHSSQEKNAIDQMADEGMMFTQFYAGDSLCTPARTALMTGRLPLRSGLISEGGTRRVLFPKDKTGLPRSEWTLPKLFQQAQYRTGMVGKWHLGINKETSTDGYYLPTNWFDFVGVNFPFTNANDCSYTLEYNRYQRMFCFIYNNSKIIQQPIRYENITQMLVDDFVRFLDSLDGQTPFFFYFSFPQLHTELFSQYTKFANSSQRGSYGSDLAEMAWAVGRAQEELEKRGLMEKTMSIFISDHGPHKEICTEGGDAGPLKGGKATTWEGGYRIPAIIKWKSSIDPFSVSHSVLSAMDFLPSFASMLGIAPPTGTVLDGQDAWDCMLVAEPGYDERPIFFYCNTKLMAMRLGRYKYHFHTSPLVRVNETDYFCPGGMPTTTWYRMNARCSGDDIVPLDPPVVYDILADQGEEYPIQYSKVPTEAVEEMVRVKANHLQTIVVGEALIRADLTSNDVIPCCNYPDCKC